jgi:feruloyl-CoA synthase
MLMAEPPSSEHGEITDKGYINQRAVLTRRADRVSARAVFLTYAEIPASFSPAPLLTGG